MDFFILALTISMLLIAIPVTIGAIALFGLFSLFKRFSKEDQMVYLPDLFPKDKQFCKTCGDSSEWCDSC